MFFPFTLLGSVRGTVGVIWSLFSFLGIAEPKAALALSKNAHVSASALIAQVFIFTPICLHTERRHGESMASALKPDSAL